MPVAAIKKCPIYRTIIGHLFIQCTSGFNPNLCPVDVRISGHFVNKNRSRTSSQIRATTEELA